MNRTFLRITSMLIVAALLNSCSTPGGNVGNGENPGACESNPAARAPIQDAALRQQIADALELSGSQPTCADMEELETLYAIDANVKSLEGLQHAINLQHLSLWDNEITDLGPLGTLESLRFLALTNNRISDVSPLLNLPALETLYIDRNRIADLEDVLQMQNLRVLRVGHNPLPYSELDRLYGLSDLEGLGIGGFSESGALELALGHPNALNFTELNVDGNQISNLSGLENLTELRVLEAQSNRIEDVTPLADSRKLRYANLADNLISDLSPLVNGNAFKDGGVNSPFFISNNCLDLVAGSPTEAHVTELKERGVNVFLGSSKECS